MVGKLVVPQRRLSTLPRNFIVHGKVDFAGVIKKTILRWGDSPGLSGWALCCHKSPHKRKAGAHDPAIPLLGIHTEEARIERDTCTPMFIAALFTIARAWKQPRCPSEDKWMRKLWYIYTMEYYSAIKKNTFASVLMRWANEVDQTPIQYTDTYIWNLERW